VLDFLSTCLFWCAVLSATNSTKTARLGTAATNLGESFVRASPELHVRHVWTSPPSLSHDCGTCGPYRDRTTQKHAFWEPTDGELVCAPAALDPNRKETSRTTPIFLHV
jgi:hypothetical protein